MRYSYFKHELKFSFDARTSRGEIKTHTAWILRLEHQNRVAYGEAAPLKGLSIDDVPDFEIQLNTLIDLLNQGQSLEQFDLERFPSLRFALETLQADFKGGGQRRLFNSEFTQGKPIPINGLVWMNEPEPMLKQAREKVRDGFDVIKFKVGAHDFDAECRMLEAFRKEFSESKVIVRLDANGAFDADDALLKLKELKRFGIHSIEQPIQPKQGEVFSEIIAKSPLKIALDEELIGLNPFTQGDKLLKQLKPDFLILKPTLLGGFEYSDAWIKLAENYPIGWWATSALESNIGLNAIAQWCSCKANPMPQGLGTGSLYSNNFKSPLLVAKGQLTYLTSENWLIPVN